MNASSNLLEVLADRFRRLQAVTDWHVKVHDDQLIHRIFLLKSLLDQIDRLLAVQGNLALHLVLV